VVRRRYECHLQMPGLIRGTMEGLWEMWNRLTSGVLGAAAT